MSKTETCLFNARAVLTLVVVAASPVYLSTELMSAVMFRESRATDLQCVDFSQVELFGAPGSNQGADEADHD